MIYEIEFMDFDGLILGEEKIEAEYIREALRRAAEGDVPDETAWVNVKEEGAG